MNSLTVAMIVKNEEKYLRDCILSIKSVADEIVIVDTGSTDKTKQIAAEFGAKVYDFVWINDFSAARNYSLQKSTGDWILYIDADERLDSNSIPELKRIISNKTLAGCYCTVLSYDSGESRDNSLRYPRLFLNSPEIKFEGRVHEQIGASLVRNKYQLLNSNILIHHLGYDISKDEQRNKAIRNLTLLREEYEFNKSAYIAFQLAQSFNVIDDQENARKYFEIAGNSNELDKSLRAQSYASLALIAHTDNKIIDAEKHIQSAIKLDSRQPFSHLLAAKIALRGGDQIKAEERCLTAYKLNKNISTEKEKSNLVVILDQEEVIYFGLTIALQNQNSNNIGFYQKELSAFYNRKGNENGPLKLAVVQKLFGCGILSSVEEEIIIEMANRYTLNLLLTLLVINPNKHQVLEITKNLLNKFPDSIEIKKILSRLLDESGKLDEAIQLLENIVEREGEDPAILFYLISFYLKKGNADKINSIVMRLEKKYSNIPEIADRVNRLKEKLAIHNSRPI
ncbi:MAG: glycosyltransferase [Melioribacteraceae bacterium]|nr:glycosyltransferase [Melioribacteraceae bacterium]